MVDFSGSIILTDFTWSGFVSLYLGNVLVSVDKKERKLICTSLLLDTMLLAFAVDKQLLFCCLSSVIELQTGSESIGRRQRWS